MKQNLDPKNYKNRNYEKETNFRPYFLNQISIITYLKKNIIINSHIISYQID